MYMYMYMYMYVYVHVHVHVHVYVHVYVHVWLFIPRIESNFHEENAELHADEGSEKYVYEICHNTHKHFHQFPCEKQSHEYS